MAFIAARTRRVRIGASVLVAAYRHPLVAAQQLATIDVLSGGRLSVRLGAGWLKSEFDALGLAHHERFGVADETLEILDRVWREPWVTHRGRYFDFEDVAVEPKPVQQPRVPLLYGGSTPAAARRAARRCDGLAPRLAQEAEDPAARLDVLRAELAGEATRVGRDPASLQLVSQASCDLDDPGVGDGTPFLHGPPAKLLEDLAELAAHGCSHCTLRVDVATGTVGEYLEQVQRLGETVVPDAARVPVAPLAL
jgi:probable F420-dependent oxidoreductase